MNKLKWLLLGSLIVIVVLGWNLFSEYHKRQEIERDMLFQYIINQKQVYGYFQSAKTDDPKELAKNLKNSYAYVRSMDMLIGNGTPIGKHLYLPIGLFEFSMDGTAIMAQAMDDAIEGKIADDDRRKLAEYNGWLKKFLDDVNFNMDNIPSNDPKMIRKKIQQFSDQYMKERNAK